ncbi:hypothetical protein PHYSODRAFT_305033 [Phytophthora sojae]|uniref:Uncharacterized protein n=1 Tax=Phytophthora sojae (strain P6497) TaxID=1094619 RepID=G5A471_PHYSP|nr:hypothetical protein PHYSODRAFT_305033 [Phytophthora sojae]EGZ09517.1 hypothetical protein PHYSODRAFT_305033 [Phytophthora sojae]|eukprot:XP_009534378.1 hypothetical protein PHYSODRAFT_305033 [Phytophthora sojae]
MTWDSDARMFGMSKEGTEVIRTVYENHLWTFNAHNIGSAITNKKKNAVKKHVFASFAVTDSVEDIDGEFDDFAADDHDDDESSHQADCDAESERCASSNIDHEDVESVAGSEDENAQDVSSENSAERELWDEILRASSLPDYDDAFEETQEGEGTGSRRDSDTEVDPEEAENNSTTEISPENVKVDNESTEAVSETAAADAEGQSGYSDQDENEDEHEVEVDEDYAQSIAHITDPTHVVEPELRGGADYDCLFDPADARELSEVAGDVNDGNDGALVPVTDHELVAVPDQIIGHRRPRDVDVRRTRERKRNKVDTKRVKETTPRRPGLREVHERRPPERFEDYQPYTLIVAVPEAYVLVM